MVYFSCRNHLEIFNFKVKPDFRHLKMAGSPQIVGFFREMKLMRPSDLTVPRGFVIFSELQKAFPEVKETLKKSFLLKTSGVFKNLLSKQFFHGIFYSCILEAKKWVFGSKWLFLPKKCHFGRLKLAILVHNVHFTASKTYLQKVTRKH